MANTPKVYVICDANCKFEGMTKEQIYAAILQAVNEGTIGDIDSGFVQTIKTINGIGLKFFLGTQAEYEALTDEEKENLFAIITNDTTKEGIIKAITDLQTELSELNKKLGEGKFSANNIITKEVTSLADLESLIANNPQGSFGIRIATDINIDGVGTLPKWGYGYLVIAHEDAALNLVGIDGAHITAYYNNNPDMRGWKIRETTKKCIWKYTSTSIYGNPLIGDTNVFASNTEKSLAVGTTLKGKRITIEIVNCYSLSSGLPVVNQHSFLTNPFTIINEDNGGIFQQTINGVNFYFRTSGNTLYFNTDSAKEVQISAYYINAIYEDN